MVGAWVKFIDEKGKHTGKSWKLPAKYNKIPAIMLFRNYFVQATVLVRREAIPKHLYTAEFEIVEDSKMWFEISLTHKVVNLQKYLLDYRVHQDNITNTGIDKQLQNTKKLFKYIFKSLQIEATEQEINSHLLIKNSKKISNIEDLYLIEKWLIKILEQNEKIKLYEQNVLKKVVLNRWLKVCFKSKHFFFQTLKIFLKSSLLI